MEFLTACYHTSDIILVLHFVFVFLCFYFSWLVSVVILTMREDFCFLANRSFILMRCVEAFLLTGLGESVL